MDIKQLVWSDWASILVPCEYDAPAVYEMRLTCGGVPRPINRFRGTDASGVLTIGETKSMSYRRYQFHRAINKGGGHSAGNLLYIVLSFCQSGNDVLADAVEYRYVAMTSKADAKQAESLLLRNYILSHCEPPPLNSAIPDRWGEQYGQWQAVARNEE